MLATQGGRFGGWAMFVVNGKPEFAYAFSNQPQHKYRVASKVTLPPGKHTIRSTSSTTAAATARAGPARSSVDGAQVAQGRIERTIPVRFSLDETFDVGEDTGTPVVEDYVYKMPFRFTGTLNKVVVTLGQ